jgi:4-hydroxyphenylpyruvate dioxygenase
MRRSIATVSMSGTLRDKLEAIAAARFDGYEIFENDLLYYHASPAEVGRIAADLGLTCQLYQPFRDFEGSPAAMFRRNLERAERKFDVMQALGCPLMLVCSNTREDASADASRMAEQLHALAERAARRNLRIGYEALAWGRVVNRYGQAWSIVREADHPHLGLVLDSFHTLSLRDDPSGIADIPGEKIFFVQMADAPWLTLDVTNWARHHRNFPGQGQFDVVNFFMQALIAGYNGYLSLEIFNDVFRETPNRRTATDAMRSLLYLESEVRKRLATEALGKAHGAAAERALARVDLFDPPAPARFSGVAFLEFAVDRDGAVSLGAWFEALGFVRAGKHRSKDVTLYRQGDINLIVNADPALPAHAFFLDRGPSVCAIGVWTDDPVRAQNRATALQSARFEGPLGPREVPIPAIVAPGRTSIYFVDQALAPDRLFEIDFVLEDTPRDAGPLRRVDHVAFGLPQGELDTWILFCRAVLGMEAGASLELADPFGLIRSGGVATPDRALRFVLNVSQSQRTRTARTVSVTGGSATVHHVGVSVDDAVAAAEALRALGTPLVPISPNYYDDLAARLDLDAATIARMRQASVLYDRTPDGGEYRHAYTASYADRFFFEIVERRNDYDAYGALNAPARMVSEAQQGRGGRT